MVAEGGLIRSTNFRVRVAPQILYGHLGSFELDERDRSGPGELKCRLPATYGRLRPTSQAGTVGPATVNKLIRGGLNERRQHRHLGSPLATGPQHPVELAGHSCGD